MRLSRMRHTFRKRHVLACAFAIVSWPAGARTAEMSFFVDNSKESRLAEIALRGGKRSIYASGEITTNTVQRFLALVYAQKIEAAQVYFDSPGGSLAAGIELGRAIRALGFDTGIGSRSQSTRHGDQIDSICASACAYAYAGGVSRYVSNYTGKLGLHQFYSVGTDALNGKDAQILSGVVVNYLSEMGIDSRAFSLATTADSEGMIWLSPRMAMKLRFANNGWEATTAEIKILEMQPYLKLEQRQRDATARVLIFCDERKISVAFGIVTNPEAAKSRPMTKQSYLELDDLVIGVLPGTSGATTSDATVWLDRDLSTSEVSKLLKTEQLGGWLDGYGGFRWGATIDLVGVRQNIKNYSQQCRV